MAISITRALTELKTIQDRMLDTYNGVVLSGAAIDGKVDGVDVETLKVKAESALQAFNALYDRRVKLKAAIVKSNAVTQVTINGETMTVAEAIEKKASITSKLDLLAHARAQVSGSRRVVDNHNAQKQVSLESLLKENLSASGGNVNQESLDAISTSFKKANFAEVFDPLNAGERYAELQKEVNTFLTEVDFTLSESNTLTLIDV